MSLGTNLNYFQASEFIVGENHPTLVDNFNRALKQLVSEFDTGADTQVTRNIIKITSATDIDPSVVDDDLVYYNTSTLKFEKAIDSSVLGFIDTTNLNIYTTGKYQLIGISTLTPGAKYYLDTTTPGSITTSNASGIYVGQAFSTNTILNTSFNNIGVDLNIGAI